jgi:hypothetical protein
MLLTGESENSDGAESFCSLPLNTFSAAVYLGSSSFRRGVSDQQQLESHTAGRGAADVKRFMSINKVRAALATRYISTRVDISVPLN